MGHRPKGSEISKRIYQSRGGELSKKKSGMSKHIIIGGAIMVLCILLITILLDHETPEGRMKRLRLMEAISPRQNLYIHTDQDQSNYELQKLRDSIAAARSARGRQPLNLQDTN